MMKKHGFTLAEVLITLTIIGVIATMTLPALLTNTQEQQSKTGLKKGVNTLTEVAQMHEAIEGFNYNSLKAESDVSQLNKTKTEEGADINGINTLAGMLKERAKVDITRTMEAAGEDGASADVVENLPTGLFGETQVVYFGDGTALIFDNAKTEASNTVSTVDGLPVGFTVIFDTNGQKGPNQLSNCSGIPGGGIDVAVGEEGEEGYVSPNDIAKCEDKGNRVIKDQFTLKLRGSIVEPEGAAAVWAFGQ